jgi:hypothetical protein
MITSVMRFFTVIIVFLIVAIAGCKKASKDSGEKPLQESSQTIPEETRHNVDGNYTYSDESAQLEITIVDGRWSGKTVMISGFGQDYDKQNMTKYDGGVVKGNTLYDESGIAQLGSVEDGRLTTSVSGKAVVLTK